MKRVRPSWEENFIELAYVVSKRSDCLSPPKGCIITKNNRVIATGYNGAPPGVTNCDEGGCQRCKDRENGKIKSGEALESCICVHAEANAILHAVRELEGATLYSTHAPCTGCAKLIISSGIKQVFWNEGYPEENGLALLLEARIIGIGRKPLGLNLK
jgi:dCMP deaminase